MKIYKELSLTSFEPWAGAAQTAEWLGYNDYEELYNERTAVAEDDAVVVECS